MIAEHQFLTLPGRQHDALRQGEHRRSRDEEPLLHELIQLELWLCGWRCGDWAQLDPLKRVGNLFSYEYMQARVQRRLRRRHPDEAKLEPPPRPAVTREESLKREAQVRARLATEQQQARERLAEEKRLAEERFRRELEEAEARSLHEQAWALASYQRLCFAAIDQSPLLCILPAEVLSCCASKIGSQRRWVSPVPTIRRFLEQMDAFDWDCSKLRREDYDAAAGVVVSPLYAGMELRRLGRQASTLQSEQNALQSELVMVKQQLADLVGKVQLALSAPPAS